MLHQQVFLLGDKKVIFQKDSDNTCWLIIKLMTKDMFGDQMVLNEHELFTLKNDEAKQFKKIIEDTNFIFEKGNKSTISELNA